MEITTFLLYILGIPHTSLRPHRYMYLFTLNELEIHSGIYKTSFWVSYKTSRESGRAEKRGSVTYSEDLIIIFIISGQENINDWYSLNQGKYLNSNRGKILLFKQTFEISLPCSEIQPAKLTIMTLLLSVSHRVLCQLLILKQMVKTLIFRKVKRFQSFLLWKLFIFLFFPKSSQNCRSKKKISWKFYMKKMVISPDLKVWFRGDMVERNVMLVTQVTRVDSPFRRLRKCLENSMENMHTDVTT